MEEHLLEITALKKVYNKKNRLFRNMDSAWNVMIEEVSKEFDEYNALLPKMRNVEERLQTMVDLEGMSIVFVFRASYYYVIIPL